MHLPVLLAIGFILLAMSFYLPGRRGRDLRRALPLAVFGMAVATSIKAEDLNRIFIFASLLGAFYLGVVLPRLAEWIGARRARTNPKGS